MERLRRILGSLSRRVRGERGQTVIEYVLVIVLIALVLVLAFGTGGVSTSISDASKNIAKQISNAAPAP